MKERQEKAEADIVIVTLRDTYHCVCERKLMKKNRNQRKTKGAAAAEHFKKWWQPKDDKNVENESKGTRNSSTNAGETTSESKSENDVIFIIVQKNGRSLNSRERFEELTQEVEGCRWNAILICETWRASNAEIWETHQGHIHGLRKIREQTRSWNSDEQEVAKSRKLDRLNQRTCYINVDHCQQATYFDDE